MKLIIIVKIEFKFDSEKHISDCEQHSSNEEKEINFLAERIFRISLERGRCCKFSHFIINVHFSVIFIDYYGCPQLSSKITKKIECEEQVAIKGNSN